MGVLDCAAAELISEMALINIAYLLCAAMFERSRGFGVLGYYEPDYISAENEGSEDEGENSGSASLD